MSDFFVRINEMNRTFFLKGSSVPRFDPARVKQFREVLADETTEFDDLLIKYHKETEADKPSATLDALVAYLDCLADHIVYCASEAARFGINIDDILSRVMDSQDSKLVDGAPVFLPDGSKFTKGPNFVGPEESIKSYLTELILYRTAVQAEFEYGPKTLWPLNINATMDTHAAYNNLEHWSCISENSNDRWQRIDGLIKTVAFKNPQGYPAELRQFDLDHPMPVELYLSCYFSKYANSGHGVVFPRPDGLIYGCAGPTICPKCAKDKKALELLKAQDDGVLTRE